MIRILFIPGLARCGTTTFVKILSQHPEVFLPKIKEPHYFMPHQQNLYSFNTQGEKIPFDKNGFLTTWKNYCLNCNQFRKYKIFIDGSTLYTGFPKSLDLIKEKAEIEPFFLILKKNPFDRALSHFLYSKSRGEEFRDFDVALKDEMKGKYKNWILKGYLQGSSSTLYEKRIEELWSREKLLVLDIEKENVFCQKTFDRITEILDLSPFSFNFQYTKNALVYTDDPLLFRLRLCAKKIRQLSPIFFDNLVLRFLFNSLIVKNMRSDRILFEKHRKYEKTFKTYFKS